MTGSHHLGHLVAFYFPWSLSLAGAMVSGPASPSLVLQLDGMSVPLLPLALALVGVVLARPLAPRSERAIGTAKFILVTVIMMIVAAAWVAQSRPGVLLAFVVSIGLGFSGYSLIELAGAEISRIAGNILRSSRPGRGSSSAADAADSKGESQ